MSKADPTKRAVIFNVRGKEFPISFCPIRLDILWNNLIKINQKSIQLSQRYIQIGQEVSSKNKTQEEANSEIKRLEADLNNLGLEYHMDKNLEAVAVALNANDLSFDKDWWLDNVSLEMLTLFLSGVVEKDLKKKKTMAQLLRLVP